MKELEASPGHYYVDEEPKAFFRLRGIRYFRYIAVISILSVPCIIFLDRWFRYRVVDIYGLGSMILAAIALMGFISQFWSNKAVIRRQKLTLHFRSHTVHFDISDVASVYRPRNEEELDLVPLPDDHVPIEFDTHWSNCVLLVMKEGAVSSSPGKVFDGLPVGYVTVSPSKPEAFIHALQARM